jgi:hypothetical protein
VIGRGTLIGGSGSDKLVVFISAGPIPPITFNGGSGSDMCIVGSLELDTLISCEDIR